MRSHHLFTLIASSACLVRAAPAAPEPGKSLIKTSPSDPGTWVTEQQKVTEYHAKGIKFVDITGITDAEVLAYYSTPDENGDDDDAANSNSTLNARAITYPTTISHRAEADPLIAQLSTANQQAWAKTLTE